MRRKAAADVALRDSPAAYGLISRLNHWLGAAAVLALLAIGLYAEDLPRGPELRHWMGLHIGIGALVVLPLVFRLGWRLTTRSPQPLPQRPLLQHASRVTHGLLLGLIAVMLVSGPWAVWSGGRAIEVFGWFTLPSPMAENHELHEALEEVHGAGSTLLLWLMVLHVGASFWHALFERNRAALARMLGPPPG